MGVMVSPLRGAEGNVEFLIHAASGCVRRRRRRSPRWSTRPSGVAARTGGEAAHREAAA